MDYGKIPRKKEWEGYEEDFHVKYAHKIFFGKSVPEGIQHFTVSGRCIKRADELLFMPRKASQYYVFAFAEHLKSDESERKAEAKSRRVESQLYTIHSKRKAEGSSLNSIQYIQSVRG